MAAWFCLQRCSCHMVLWAHDTIFHAGFVCVGGMGFGSSGQQAAARWWSWSCRTLAWCWMALLNPAGMQSQVALASWLCPLRISQVWLRPCFFVMILPWSVRVICPPLLHICGDYSGSTSLSWQREACFCLFRQRLSLSLRLWKACSKENLPSSS